MEKNINIPVSKVNLMIDDPSILTINISTNKNYDNKQLQKKHVEYLIQDLRQQILSNNKDLRILHIIVQNFIIDGNYTQNIPLNQKCENLIIEVNFICIKKDLIDNLQRTFKNIKFINSIMSTKYAQSLLKSGTYNLLDAGLGFLNGLNYNEVLILLKKTTKLGFF